MLLHLSPLGHIVLCMAQITPTMALAQVIKAEADRQQLSLRKLAELAHLPTSTFHRSIFGDWPRPLRWDELVKVAGALGTRASVLADQADALVDAA